MDVSKIENIKNYEHHPDGITEVREVSRQGKRFIITRRDPYGFLTISFPNYSGDMRPELSGNFITLGAVETAITRYLAGRKGPAVSAKKAQEKELKEKAAV